MHVPITATTIDKRLLEANSYWKIRQAGMSDF